MRFSGEEMVFLRLEIRSKATNVAEIETKSIRGSVKTPKVVSRGTIRLGYVCGPLALSFRPTYITYLLQKKIK